MRRAVMSFLVGLTACDSPSTGPVELTSGGASAAASGTAPLRIAQPRATKDTSEAELGTLPEGVGIAAGNQAPPFELRDKDGRTVRLADLLAKSEVLLVFYRGGW